MTFMQMLLLLSVLESRLRGCLGMEVLGFVVCHFFLFFFEEMSM